MTLYQARSSVTLQNDTTKTLYVTVPQGKKWFVYGVMMYNGDNIARDMKVWIADGSNNILHRLGNASSVDAGGSREMLGYVSTGVSWYGINVTPIPIKGGNKLVLIWSAGGASSGGTAYYCITYEEVPE